jgi:hypothetical protein
MLRNGSTLYEEQFTVRAGGEVVLTAWDKARGVKKKPVSR